MNDINHKYLINYDLPYICLNLVICVQWRSYRVRQHNMYDTQGSMSTVIEL